MLNYLKKFKMPACKKTNKDREKDKSREFVLVLYPENEAHCLAYLALTGCQYSALCVLHDKDTYIEDKIDEETGEFLHKAGDLKKDHYHFYIKFRNPRSISGIAKELNIEPHLIEFCESNMKAYAEYMLHWGKHGGAGKYIYDLENLEGALKSSVMKILSNEPVDLQVYKIFKYIRSIETITNFNAVTDWAFKNGYFGVLRSNHSLVDKWITAHNNRFYYQKYK